MHIGHNSNTRLCVIIWDTSRPWKNLRHSPYVMTYESYDIASLVSLSLNRQWHLVYGLLELLFRLETLQRCPNNNSSCNSIRAVSEKSKFEIWFAVMTRTVRQRFALSHYWALCAYTNSKNKCLCYYKNRENYCNFIVHFSPQLRNCWKWTFYCTHFGQSSAEIIRNGWIVQRFLTN